MSKYVSISVSTSLSNDFYLEVPDNASEEEIKRLAEKQIVLPHNYHKAVNQVLARMGIRVRDMDSMFRDWHMDELEFIVNDRGSESTEGKQQNA